MSWSELERLVATAEADGALRRALKRCRSQPELILAAALAEHRREQIQGQGVGG